MTFAPSELWIHPGWLAGFTLITVALGLIGLGWLLLGLTNVREWNKDDLKLCVTVVLCTGAFTGLFLWMSGDARADLAAGREALRASIQERYGLEIGEDAMESLNPSDRGAARLWDLHEGKGEQKYWAATVHPVELVLDGERQSVRLAWLGDQWVLEDANGNELPQVDTDSTTEDTP